MRIAIVTTSWPGAGDDPCAVAGHFVRAETAELEREGHDVVVVAPPAGGPASAFGWPGVAARLRARPQRAVDAARWVREARRRVRSLDVDRVVAHWAIPCAWPIAAASPARNGRRPQITEGVAIEVVSHGGDVRLLAAMPSPLRDGLALAIAGRARTWRFVSPSLRDTLLGVLGREARAGVASIACVRPASLDLPDVRGVRDEAARLRRQLGAGRVAVSVGRLVRSKRVDRVIDHVAAARELDTLVVVGDGPERARLEALARARRVRAHFLGVVPRDRALAWIAAAHVVVHASEAEGLCTVLREAEALGTPVVRLDRGDR
jgi:glycosyltransferase involved in cell wall biosynthesis